jgi:amino acid transporter
MGAADVALLGHVDEQRATKARERTLTVLPLAALIFFEVSGGPFGVEDAVGAAGPFWALLGFVVFPLVWSVPEALVTAELTGIFPENAGYVAWVTEAFGPCLGFVEGWCSWWSGAIDNAIYPGLFLQYLKQLSGAPGEWLDNRNHFLVALLAVNVVLTYVSWRGLEGVAKTAMVLGLLAVSPFFAMTVLAIPHLDLARLSSRKAQPDWRLLLNTLMWNLNCKSQCIRVWHPATVQTVHSSHSFLLSLRKLMRRLGLCINIVWRSSAPRDNDSPGACSDCNHCRPDVHCAYHNWMRACHR